jgi:hypothetical protein
MRSFFSLAYACSSGEMSPASRKFGLAPASRSILSAFDPLRLHATTTGVSPQLSCTSMLARTAGCCKSSSRHSRPSLPLREAWCSGVELKTLPAVGSAPRASSIRAICVSPADADAYLGERGALATTEGGGGRRTVDARHHKNGLSGLIDRARVAALIEVLAHELLVAIGHGGRKAGPCLRVLLELLLQTDLRRRLGLCRPDLRHLLLMELQ